MESLLFFDTETTGVKPQTARIVQLAAIQTDMDGNELQQINLIVRPDGFEIPKEASAVHGITTEMASAVGVSRASALGPLVHLWRVCERPIAHNFDYDHEIIANELARLGKTAEMLEGDPFCTMKTTTDLCQIPFPPGAWRPRNSDQQYKWPRLTELYHFLFGEDFQGAHNALSDVRATVRCYFELKRRYPELVS